MRKTLRMRFAQTFVVAIAVSSAACAALAPKKNTTAAKPAPAPATQAGPTWDSLITRGTAPTDRDGAFEKAQAAIAAMQEGNRPVDLHLSEAWVALRGLRDDEAKALWDQAKEARDAASPERAPANTGETDELHSRAFQSVLQSANFTLTQLSHFEGEALYALPMDHWIYKRKLARKSKRIQPDALDKKVESLVHFVGEYESKAGTSPRARLVADYLASEAARLRPTVVSFHEKQARLATAIDADKRHAALLKQIDALGQKIKKEEASSRMRVSSCRGKTASTKLCKLNAQQQSRIAERIERAKELYRSLMQES